MSNMIRKERTVTSDITHASLGMFVRVENDKLICDYLDILTDKPKAFRCGINMNIDSTTICMCSYVP